MDEKMLRFYKPLLNNEEFAKVLEEDNDASIWLALKDAALSDPVLNQVFSLAQVRKWSRFRTVMVCSYIMAQRFEKMMELEMQRLAYQSPRMYFCSGCSKELHLEEKLGPTTEDCAH